jgi:hypothetical protein
MYFILHQSSHQIVALSSAGAKSTIYQGHDINALPVERMKKYID